MIIAEQAIHAGRDCPQDFQMIVSLASDDNNTDDNIMSRVRAACESGFFP
jgi:hypothetical protein